MAETRIRFTAPEIVTVLVSFCAAMTAAGLTLFVERSQSEIGMLLFYPLMPGLIAGLLITGAHGGTAAQESVAPIVAALINAVFYAFLIIYARWTWRKLIALPTAYARNPQNNQK
jgi:predicted membrane metal-binding protein